MSLIKRREKFKENLETDADANEDEIKTLKGLFEKITPTPNNHY